MSVILITGASGLLGGNLAADWAGQHEVHGVFHQHRLVLEGVQMIGADLADRQQVRTVFGKVKPDVVVHCAAATDLDRCERDPAWAQRLNVEMTAAVAAASSDHGASLISISTDAVFDGTDGPYDEEAKPNPLSAYGKTKLAGEQAALSAAPGSLVVRTNLFGWSLGPNPRGLAEWFLNQLDRREPCIGFTDVFFSPILVNDLGPILLRLVATGSAGLLHVGGADCLTKYEFGRKLAASFGYRDDLIEPGSVGSMSFAAPRAGRLCMDSSKVKGVLGISLPRVDDGIQRMRSLAASKGGRLGLAARTQMRES
jgi:dTDP-4-dehydrorhamnose reductase